MRYVPLLMLLLVIPFASAYQQSYLIFDLDDSWEIQEQRRAVQSFVKDTLYVQVRMSTVEQISASEFASRRDGEVISEKMYGPVNESVVVDDQNAFANAILEHDGETYVITMFGDADDLKEVQSEMQKLYKTFKFSNVQRFVEAPYEVELDYPGELPYLERHPIPWGWVLFWLIVALLVVWKVRKRFHKKGEAPVKEHKEPHKKASKKHKK